MSPRNLASLLASLALALSGCGDPDEPSRIEQELTSPYGTLTSEVEAPDFGDPDLGEPDLAMVDPAVVDATFDADTDIVTIEGDTIVKPAHLRFVILWGHLRPKFDETAVTDWSGTVTVTNAAFRVLRTIAFEPGDALTLPRPDVHTLDFVSLTKPSADGLLIDLVFHPLLNPNREPVTITLTTAVPGAESVSITLAPGVRPAGVIPVGTTGLAVAYHALLPDRDGCTEGALDGRWIRVGTVEGRAVGRLKGRFISADGALRGKLRGVWGERPSGAQVWFAKVIAADGAFLGLLAGKYDAGRFAGLYLGADKKIEGAAFGRYFLAPEGPGGFFAGRWSHGCAEHDGEGTVPPSDEEAPPLPEAAPQP